MSIEAAEEEDEESMPNRIDNYIAKRLRILRYLKEMTLEEAADRAGISSQQLEEYESGAATISAGLLFHISTIFGVPIHWFFENIKVNDRYDLVNDDSKFDSTETKDLLNVYYQCNFNLRRSIRRLANELAKSSRH